MLPFALLQAFFHSKQRKILKHMPWIIEGFLIHEIAFPVISSVHSATVLNKEQMQGDFRYETPYCVKPLQNGDVKNENYALFRWIYIIKDELLIFFFLWAEVWTFTNIPELHLHYQTRFPYYKNNQKNTYTVVYLCTKSVECYRMYWYQYRISWWI